MTIPEMQDEAHKNAAPQQAFEKLWAENEALLNKRFDSAVEQRLLWYVLNDIDPNEGVLAMTGKERQRNWYHAHRDEILNELKKKRKTK